MDLDWAFLQATLGMPHYFVLAERSECWSMGVVSGDRTYFFFFFGQQSRKGLPRYQFVVAPEEGDEPRSNI